MTDIRELLELAARAMGFTIKPDDLHTKGTWDGEYFIGDWDPSQHSLDCSAMCARLGINTEWHWQYVHATKTAELFAVRCFNCHGESKQLFSDHNNSHAAAWRLAALRVAAEIGKGMQG